MATLSSHRVSRDEYRKAKELEELRKTGAAPPEVDAEGAMINPHIPQYISKSPWYLNDDRPGLKHQKSIMFQSDRPTGVQKASFTEHYQRGRAAQAAAAAPTKFIPGACTNCGSTTHKVKDCLERPRKKGAALTGKDIAAPDVIQQLEFTYEGKRDRWNGYDPREHAKIIQRFERTELERKKKKLAELDEAFEREKQEEKRRAEEEARKASSETAPDASEPAAAAAGAADGDAAASADGDAPDDASAADEARRLRALKKREKLQKLIRREQRAASHAAPGGGAGDKESDSDSDSDASDSDDDEMRDDGAVHQKKDSSARMTVRNLRIREDTAKYLRNLDLNSAHFDPKTRSMRENPYGEGKDPNDLAYAGDNFVRKQGQTREIQQLQSFVWEAVERGHEGIHVQALPSQAEKLFHEHQQRKEQLAQARKQAIQEKYGAKAGVAAAASAAGAASTAVPRELLYPAVETYVEYDETGAVIKGVERAAPKTKYAEDVYENGHKAVWGSWFKLPSRGGQGIGEWGYACCHQTIRHAICTGDVGKRAAAEMAAQLGQRTSFKDAAAAAASSSAAATATPANAAPSSAAAAAASRPPAAVAAPPATAAPPAPAATSSSLAMEVTNDASANGRHEKRKRRASRSRSSSSSSSSSSRSASRSSSPERSSRRRSHRSSHRSRSHSRSSSSSSSSSSSDSDSDSDSHRRRRHRRSRSKSKSKSKSSAKKQKRDASPPRSTAAATTPASASAYHDQAPSDAAMDEYYRSKHSGEDPLHNIPSDKLLDL